MQMADEHIDIRQYINAIGRRKGLILGIAVAATVLVGAVLFNIEPVYRATATIMIESQEMNVVSIQDVYGVDTGRQEYLQTQFEILKSIPLAEKVIGQLNLPDSYEFQDLNDDSGIRSWLASWLMFIPQKEALTEEERRLRIVEHYDELLTVNPVRSTQLAKVSFESRDPAQAAAVANAHANAFIQSHLEARSDMSGTALDWMTARLKELRQALTDAEKKLQEFKEREQLVDVDGIQSMSARELNQLSTKLVDARRDLSEVKNAYVQTERAKFANLDDKLAIPAIKSDPLVQQFRQARAEADLRVAELSRRYGNLHPKMRAAMSERDAAEKALSNQVDSVIDAIRNEYRMLQGEESSIASEVETAKLGVQSVGRKESEFRSLMREVETNRQLYDLFHRRLSETKETADLVTPNAHIVEPANVPLKPAKPKKLLILVVAFVLALLFAVIIALVLDFMNNTIRHAADLEQKLGLPLLGLVPMLTRKLKSREMISTEFNRSDSPAFNESVRTLRTGVTLSTLDKSQKLIIVASSVSGEGKTTVACNLALAFAKMERVLLIDADLRKPVVAAAFNIDRTQLGLTDVFAGNRSIKECIVTDQQSRLDILTAGVVPPNPQELLGARRLKVLLEKLKEHYDRIIIDCSPVLPVSDALLLGKMVDSAIYVVKADSTSVGQVKAGLAQLQRAQIPIMGMVLNQIDTAKIAAYGEYGGAYMTNTYPLNGTS